MDGHAPELERRPTNADTQPRAWFEDARTAAKNHFSKAVALREDRRVQWQAGASKVLINPSLLFCAQFDPSHVFIQRHNPCAALSDQILKRMIHTSLLPRRLLDSQPSRRRERGSAC